MTRDKMSNASYCDIAQLPENKIGDFWEAVSGGPQRYVESMPQRHLPLWSEEKHFESWFDLWRRTCRIPLPSIEVSEMIRFGEGIGVRLKALFAQDRLAGQ